MSNWDRSSGTDEEAGRGAVSPGGLEELRPARPDRVLPRWLGPLLGFVIGAALIMAVGGLTDVFDADPTEAEAAALFDQGFAAGTSQARDEADTEAARRESAAFARGETAGLAQGLVEVEALIREAEGLATRAAGASVLVLASVERDQGIRVAFDRGFQDGFEAGFEDGYEMAKRQAMALGVVLEGSEPDGAPRSYEVSG